MVTKISLIGKPEVGKTTIKRVIFEGEDPNNLILFPLEATIGIKYSVHDFMDLKLSLLDVPGQSMAIFLEDEEKQVNIFEDTGAIIYIFDYKNWIKKQSEIINDVNKIFHINKNNQYNAKLYLFLHKIDLMNKNVRDKLNVIKEDIIKQLDLPEKIPIYFTSLHPDLIYTMFNALSDTLSIFSKDISNLKENINELMKDLSQTICFVSNQQNNLVIQSMTLDYDTELIHKLHNKINDLIKINEESTSNENKLSVIDIGPKLLNYIIKDISNFHPNFNKMMFLSDVLNRNELSKVCDNLIEKLNENNNKNS